MDFFTISIGILIAAFGCYTIIVRIKDPEKLRKLQAMKNKFGATAGTVLHSVAYSVLPIVLGGLVVSAGVGGISILQFISP